MTHPRTVNGIPWNFLDPEAEWVAWQNRIAAFEAENRDSISELSRTLSRSSHISPLVNARIENLLSARVQLSKIVESILPEFYPFDSRLYDVTLALRSRTSKNQGLLSYASNILRDWAKFGEEENRLNLDLLKKLLGSSDSKRTLVMGAGAGRLSYDFHQNLTKGTTTALDHNPLLLSFAKKMAEDKVLSWSEFPQNPSDQKLSAVIEECRASGPARPGLHFELGDLMASEIPLNSYDLVLTPWVIDIVPESFEQISLRVNSLLEQGGFWVNFGPLAFSHENPLERHSKAEILELLEKSGFAVEFETDSELPYLKSPHHRGYRMETVFGFRARKVHAASEPSLRTPLPDYLLNLDLPVPLLPEISELKQKSVIFGTVCSWIDGKRSMRELSTLLHTHYGIPIRDSELALQKFLADRGT